MTRVNVWAVCIFAIVVIFLPRRSQAFRCTLSVPTGVEQELQSKRFAKLFLPSHKETEFAAWVLGKEDAPLWVEYPSLSQRQTLNLRNEEKTGIYFFEIKSYSFESGSESTVYKKDGGKFSRTKQTASQTILQIEYLDWSKYTESEGSLVPRETLRFEEKDGRWHSEATKETLEGTVPPEVWNKDQSLFAPKTTDELVEEYRVVSCTKDLRKTCIRASYKLKTLDKALSPMEEELPPEVTEKLQGSCEAKILVQKSAKQTLLTCGNAWGISFSARFMRRVFLSVFLHEIIKKCQSEAAEFRMQEALLLKQKALVSQALAGLQKTDFPEKYRLHWAELEARLGSLGQTYACENFQEKEGQRRWMACYQMGLREVMLLPVALWKSSVKEPHWKRAKADRVHLWASFDLQAQEHKRLKEDELRKIFAAKYGFPVKSVCRDFPTNATVQVKASEHGIPKDVAVISSRVEKSGSIHVELSYPQAWDQVGKGGLAESKLGLKLGWKTPKGMGLSLEGEATFGRRDWEDIGEKRVIEFDIRDSFWKSGEGCTQLEVTWKKDEEDGKKSMKLHIDKRIRRYRVLVDGDSWAYRCLPVIKEFRTHDDGGLVILE